MSSHGKPVSICDALIMSKRMFRGFWVTERYRYQTVSESSKKFLSLNIGVQGNLSFWKTVYTIIYLLLSVAWKKILKKYWSWWRIVFTEWLTHERRLFLCPGDRYHCQRFSPTRRQQYFFVEWRCAVVIRTKLQRNLIECLS